MNIHGNIRMQLADSVKISYSPATINYSPKHFSAFLKQGNFSLTIPVPDGFTILTMENGEESTELYVQPGADLALTVNAKNFDSTLHYEGTGKEIANYMAKCVLEKHTMRYINLSAQTLGSKTELKEYEAALKELIQKEYKYIDDNGKELPSAFVMYMKTAMQYEVYYTMHMYPYRMEVHKQGSTSIKDGISKEFYAVIDDIPAFFNDKYVSMPSYQAYLNNFIGMQIYAEDARNGATLTTREVNDSIFSRAYRVMPPLTSEFFIGRKIFNSVQHITIEEMIREVAWYKAHYPASRNNAILEAELAKKRLVGPGKPEIDFDITTPEGKHMKLSDLKGKVVYIDFWARHCVPCVAEMKYANKIRAHYKGKAVAFVYVSEDDDEGIWKKSVNELGLTDGINTQVGTESSLVDRYEAGAIPIHYLIDRDGNFSSETDVARPREEQKLMEQIDKLLHN